MDDFFAGVRRRDLSLLSRAFTLIESSSAQHQADADQLLTRLLPYTGNAIRVGITGAPGVGKSTFIEALGLLLVQRGLSVAVLAVDPSSGVTGGSILGDKTRMTKLASHPQAFIRPSPAAGTLGGVANKTRENIYLAEAAKFDVVLVETVGVGQSETMVADMTDCFLALMLPGAGDELQGIKRGLLELADVIAVNKADGKNLAAAQLAAQQLRNALDSLEGDVLGDTTTPTIHICSAREPMGIEAIWDALVTRRQRLSETGQLAERRQQQNVRWLWSLVDEQVRQAIRQLPAVQTVCQQVESQVLKGQMPAAIGARKIVSALLK